MKKYIRSERANLFEPNVYISMIVKISGNIPKEEIQYAVESAYEANEATMSKIVLEDNGDAYYEKMQRSGCRFFNADLPWQELLKRSEKKPFAIMEGELVRTFLTQEDGKIILFLHAHHLVGDGKSVLILLADMVKCLAGKDLTYKPMTLVNRDFLTKKAALPFGMKMAMKRVNRRWTKTGKHFSWDDYYAIHNKYWAEHTSEIERKTYDVNRIKSQCTNGATINSYMITTLLREHPECKVVGIPVSIRENDPGMSNQTSGIAINYRYKTKRSFEDNLKKVHKSIYKKIKNRNMRYFVLLFMEQLCPSLIDAVLLQTHGCHQNRLSEKMAQVLGYAGKGGRDMGVTNLNRIDIPGKYRNDAMEGTEDTLMEDILFIPPKVSYSKTVIGISTYKDVLSVCCHRM